MKKKYLILVLIIVISTAVYVFAKYSVENKRETLYVADSFYFESNVLTSDNQSNLYTMQEGIDYITIDLKNNADDLRFADVDIDYQVKITDLENNPVVDKNGNTVSNITGNLAKGKISTAQVTFSNLKSGTYIVTATATSPYTKTVKANFVINQNNPEISYDVKDTSNSPVVQLTVQSNDYSGNVRISWPSGVAPDSTNINFQDINLGYAGGSKIISFSSNSEYVIQFFKQNLTNQYVKNDFSVERSN